MLLLHEHDTTFRQIFMDGRPLPEDPFPTWMGYSIGRWDQDVFVVTTSGLDVGHMDVEVTKQDSRLAPSVRSSCG